MTEDKFKEVENQYLLLKEKRSKNEISVDDFKKKLKQLMVVDKNDHYWMIGGKTGKWYFYNGTDWIEGNPYLQFEGKEQKAEISTDAANLYEPIILDQPVEPKLPEKKVEIKGTVEKKEERPKGSFQEILILGINKKSFFFFCGGFGLITGVILGAFFGFYPIMGKAIQIFPRMLQDLRGGFTGALVFSFIGGAIGFITLGVVSLIMNLLYDFIVFIFGGIRLRVRF